MKIKTIQQQPYSVRFRGLIKGSKTIPESVINNYSKEILEENRIKLQKQIKDLGLVVIKEIKMYMQTKQLPIK